MYDRPSDGLVERVRQGGAHLLSIHRSFPPAHRNVRKLLIWEHKRKSCVPAVQSPRGIQSELPAPGPRGGQPRRSGGRRFEIRSDRQAPGSLEDPHNPKPQPIQVPVVPPGGPPDPESRAPVPRRRERRAAAHDAAAITTSTSHINGKESGLSPIGSELPCNNRAPRHEKAAG